MKKIILDVDTGIDDALGIILAVKSKQLDIQAITTVCGNVSLEQATVNTGKVLDLLGRPDIPVYRGAETPLIRPEFNETRIHGQDGIGGALAVCGPFYCSCFRVRCRSDDRACTEPKRRAGQAYAGLHRTTHQSRSCTAQIS